ncbi:agmatinase [Thalassotalea piscium]
MAKIKQLMVELDSVEVPFQLSKNADGIYANCIHIIGFEYDGTACFRKGTKAGPNALRAVADGIETFSPYLNADLSDVVFYDLGNLKIRPEFSGLSQSNEAEQHSIIEQQWQYASDDFTELFSNIDLEKDKVKIITLGGEHSISYAPIKTYLEQYPDLVLIHLDAHADLRDGYLGFHYSHASIIRRVVDHFGDQHQLIQYGIRSGTKEEYQWMKTNQTIKTSRKAFFDAVNEIANDRPIYLTLDLDYFDPSFFPGTGTPEPGGEDFHSFVGLCKLLKEKNFVGCDVVELSPEIDSTGNSDVFAAKVVRELILCLA